MLDIILDKKICEKREQLNNSILTGQDYNITYKLSIELDELITEYYKIELNRTKKTLPKKKKRFKKLNNNLLLIL